MMKIYINQIEIIKMIKLADLIKELESNIPDHEQINRAISVSSVGWHIEHSLLAINNIISALKNSEPGKYSWKFNPIRTLVLTMKNIPRGKGKAPEIVMPDDNIDEEKLKKHIQETLEKINIIERLNPDSHFEHPFFGMLNLKPSVKFLEIHTNHHIKIIKDILK